MILYQSFNLLFLSGSADFIRSSGKIYVVIGVVLIIFIAITAFLFLLERRIGKLEKEIKDDKAKTA